MFHTILTISYLIPGIYLFIRIWQLFIPGNYRLRYVFIFALLFSIFPISNLQDEGELHILEHQQIIASFFL
jgi:hypothetical protein